MANYATLKAAIQDVVKTNGNNEITGALLQQSLVAMINSLGALYQFAGVAIPATNPGTPDQNVVYLAGPGTYPSFGGFIVPDSAFGIFTYNGTWNYEFVTISDLLRVAGIRVVCGVSTYYPIHLQSGKTYIFENNTSTACYVYLRVQKNSTNQQLISIPANGSVEITTLFEFNFIYPSVQTDIWVREKDSLVDRVSVEETQTQVADNETRAFASINSLAMGNTASIGFAGRISTNWVTNEDSEHILFIVKPGDEITIRGNLTIGTQYGLLSSYPTPVNGQRVKYCAGTTRVIVGVGATSQTTAPVDAKFLCVNKKIAGVDYTPASILINGQDPFFEKTIRQYLAELKTAINGVSTQFIIGAKVTLAGNSQSLLILNTPIVLSQNGDEIEIEVSTQDLTATSLGFSNSGLQSNGYYAIQLAKNAVGVRATDGTWLHQSTSITTDGNIKLRIAYANGNIYTYVNGQLKNTYTGQKTIQISSFGNGGNGTYGYWSGTINSVKVNGEDINLYIQDIRNATVDIIYRFLQRSDVENLDMYPRGILKYDAASKHFDFYSQLGKSNKYFQFRVKLDENNTDLVYLKEWRLSSGKAYSYDGETFTEIAETIHDAENEMAMYFSGASDYTGGIHGDERIDVSPLSFVKFFADGRLISDAEMASDFTIECASFAYMQLSTLHETSTEQGQFVAGHPIVAYHYKRNTFEECSSKLENVIKFTSEQRVTQYHAGMMCVGKGAGLYALLPGMVETPELSGTNSHYDADDFSASRVDLWNPTTGFRCFVDGKMTQGIDDTNIQQFQIWDRTTDSKYYRRLVKGKVNALVFAANSFIRNEQIVKFY